MKRLFILLVLSPLAACGRSEANQQQDAARLKFQQAQQHIEKANAGFYAEGEAKVNARKLADSTVERKPYDKTIDEYRIEQLQAASDLIKQLAAEGGPIEQKMAAHLLLGENHAVRARRHAQQASSAFAGQSALVSRLFSSITAVRSARSIANAYNQVDHSAILAELKGDLTKYQAAADELTAEVNQFKQQIADLNAKIAAHHAERNKFLASVDEFSRAAFVAKGQAQYDLYVKAAEATRSADKQGSAAEQLNAELSLAQSRMNVQQTLLDQTNDTIAGTNESIEGLEQRIADTKKLADEANAAADTAAAEFNAQFKELVTVQTEQVDKHYEQATAEFDQSIDEFQKASQSGVNRARDTVQLYLGSVQAQKAHYLYQQLLVVGTYHDLTKALSEATAAGLSAEQAQQVAAVATDAEAKVTALTEAATTTFTAAGETLRQAADAAAGKRNDPGAKDRQRAALSRLVYVHRAMARLTGDAAHTTQADTVQQELNAASQE